MCARNGFGRLSSDSRIVRLSPQARSTSSSHQMSLQNKVAIVTGGSRGMGAGTAKELAFRGAKVLITYASNTAKADAVVAAIKAKGGEAASVQADCMDEASPKLVVDTCVRNFGQGIDIIVNNAGAGDEVYLKDTDMDHWNKLFHTNVRFPMFLVKESLPYLQKGGRIVNLSSVVARQAYTMQGAYGASKACMESLARTWALELGASHGITVNCVNPGPVATEMWAATPEESIGDMAAFIKSTPAEGRVGEVEDIVPIVAFLCDETSRWITGSTVCANGGICFT
ncbi:unnamed protein product [Clonostachys solani]|uniref:Ketoreductase domain-containing protein n=1 Tax=Clonostachys solani TaxID=160281 RepID=A0A9P0EQK7_9HYPO|nr:unnamed protein product [Clonostachys solani]